MVPRRFPIEQKIHRPTGYYLANVSEFVLGEAQSIDLVEIVENPLLSLYCFDDDNREAIFVELPAGVDLTKAPFVYATQYENAQRVVTVPYEAFMKLSDALPEVQRPIMIYMSGRSGSTLLSHILNDSDAVISLSEPDVATQISHFWSGPGGSRDNELRRLARSTVRFLFKAYPSNNGKAHAIKFRAEGLRTMDLFQSVFPEVKNLFSYRDALGWANSFYRILRNYQPSYYTVSEWLDLLEIPLQADLSYLLAYLDTNQEKISIPEQLTLWWFFNMEWYLRQVSRGVPALAIRYTDLIQKREETLRAIFNYCDLPLESVPLAMRAFTRDSQADTEIARDDPKQGSRFTLDEDQIDSVKAILRRHPILNISDFTVPNTLNI